ncbi:S41 family peptidase [bacterium]|nr:S41 family peptidase [bacterium]MBU1073005.1 S41 family peptidase [bacterium]MBU1676839.1 S41 family peptidase [bacterium]
MNAAKRFRFLPPRRSLLTLVLAALVLVACWHGTVHAKEAGKGTDRQQFLDGLKILGSVYERVFYNYVEDVDAYELLEAGIDGMLDFLDEHTQYLPPSYYEDLMMSTEGEFGGLGITINIRDHYPTVVSPIEGTPAFLMGIQGGDKIIEIEGESTLDFTSNDAVGLLRGEPGTQVTITIQREGRDEPFPLTITRDIIQVDSVPYAFMIDDIGYIRVANFSRTTTDELVAKLAELEAQGARGLILDLRWNPGGLLEAANGVSELFLDEGDLIVYTKGRLRNQNRSYYAEGKAAPRKTGLPSIIMVNGSSASASEIVAAAVQDHDMGMVVGKTTFGKGTVQTVFPLSDDRALKLTTAKYYTPSGRSIHKDRHVDDSDLDLTVAPDGAQGDGAEVEKDVPRDEKEKFSTDAGRIVYGGGGITPDMEIEQPFLSDFEVALERDGALFSFATTWSAHHEVPRDIVVGDEMFQSFSEHLATREKIDEYLGVYDLARSDSLLVANGDYIRKGIRRELMRRNYGPQAAYQVAIEDDVQLLETLDIFKRARTTEDLLAIAAEWEAERVARSETEVETAVQ